MAASAPASCEPVSAITTPDNDIRLTADERPVGERTALPAAVVSRLRDIVGERLKAIPEQYREVTDCERLVDAIYRLDIPSGDQLFVARLGIRFMGTYDLIALDPTTGRVTNHPAELSYWEDHDRLSEEMLKTPVVSFADLYRNGRNQIVFEQKIHAGSFYNSVIYHYFEIGTDLSLTPVLALEARLFLSVGDRGTYERRLTASSPGRIRIETFFTPDMNDGRPSSVGYLSAQSGQPGAAFHLTSLHPTKPILEGLLISAEAGGAGGGREDLNRLLAEGCRNC